MEQSAFQRILEYSAEPAAQQETVEYLSTQLHRIVHKGESVLICFPKGDDKNLGPMLERAILNAEATPIFWEDDFRWSELLRLAFFTRASTIIGTPLTVLGLSKLAAFRGVPLFALNVVLTGYPCSNWMMDGIVSGLDCQIWGLLAPRLSSIVAGFSCDRGRGVHLRQDQYDIRIKDPAGLEVPDGVCGKVYLVCKEEPSLEIAVNTSAELLDTPCSCGDPSPKLVSMDYGARKDAAKYRVLEELLYWNSILDCWVDVTEHGMELEVLSLPGLRLPKLPSCAKLVLRNWDPNQDIPFEVRHHFEKSGKFI